MTRTRMISEGETLYSASGRRLAPVPKFAKRIALTLKRFRAWQLEEARKEAEHVGNTFHANILHAIDLKNWAPADGDDVNAILFGDPDGVRPINRKKPTNKGH